MAMKPLAAFAFALLGLVSCAPSGPQSRIARHPEVYARLGEREKQLVERGELARGMAPEAVLLAWGEPTRRYEGEQDSKASERWDYIRDEPLAWDGAYAGPGYGEFGPYRYRSYGFGLGTGVAYAPVLRARVMFLNGRVDSWERGR